MDEPLRLNTTPSINLSLNNTLFIDDDYKPYSERLETYIVPLVFAFIFVVGVLGNGTLVLIFIKHKNMRNVPNIYILSLALGDLLVIISCVPFTSTTYLFESYPFSTTICKISESSKDISVGVSVFTLTALSADRFFAIVDPLRKLHSGIGGKRATRCTILIVTSIWVFAIVCAIPAVTLSHIKDIRNETNVTLFVVCYPYPPIEGYPNFDTTVVILKFLIYYFVPLFIIACFYSLMARSLIMSTRNMPGELQGQTRQIRARKKVAKTVLTFVVVFAICFFPQHLFFLWFYINKENREKDYNAFWHYLRIVGFFLAFINSCINPIALYCVSGTFRKYFQKYLFCRMGSKIINSRNMNARRLHRPSTYSSTRKWDSTMSTSQHPNHYQMNTFRRNPQNDPITMATEITKVTNGDQIIM